MLFYNVSKSIGTKIEFLLICRYFSGVNEKEYNAFEMDDQLYSGSNGNQDKNTQHVKEEASSQPQEQNNDDLLYDPNLDDEDERWIEKERQKHRVKKSK